MKKVRKKRKQKGLCSRCGNERENKEYALCKECREYISNHKENYNPPKDPVIIRNLKKWDITNYRLYNALIMKSIKISELAEKVGVTTRSAERWVFENTEPTDIHKYRINQVLGKKIYDV